MRVLLCGDWHANWPHAQRMIALAHQQECDAIIQLGDFGWWPHLAAERDFIHRVEAACAGVRIPLLWIDGNHENFHDLEVRPWRESADGFSMSYQTPGSRGYLEWVRYLPRGARWECEGVRLLALGGAYSVDKDARTPGIEWWPQETITDFQVAQALMRAEAEGPVDVMLTHDSPVNRLPELALWLHDLPESFENRRQVRRVVEACKPRLLYHAHYHLDRAYTLDRADGGITACRCLHTDGATTGSFALLDTRDLIDAGGK